MLSKTLTFKPRPDAVAVGRLASHLPWQRLSLVAVLLLAAFLNVFRLSEQGLGNTYYTAAVASMVQNWHAFFFASFDAAGFVTVDKPPLGLWFQAASAKLFGVSGYSVILPQVIAGVLAVAVLYHLVRRTWGPVAGLLAALALALSPVSVVTSRTNNLDSLLVLAVLLAAWAVLKAAETGRLRWLLLGFALVGLGFNIKMLQAFLVLPALGAVYFLGARTGWWRRIGHLAAAAVVLAAVSLSWAVVVDLTPADARPYIGSSEHNSAIDLALGYNGLQRLLGRGGPGGDGRPADGDATMTPSGGQPDGPLAPPAWQAQMQPADAPRPDGPGGGPGGEGENGEKGALRLLNRQLGGQIGWLLPFALIGFVGAASLIRPRLPLDDRARSLVLWGVWFATMAVFFSVAGFYHRYYLVMLAPAVAALGGAGAVSLWALYRRPGIAGWLLPVAVLATAAVQAHILADYPDWRGRLTPVALGLGGALALALVVARLRPSLRALRSPALALALGVPALLAAPAAWAGISIWQGSDTTLPAAGPGGGGFGGPGGGPGLTGDRNAVDQALLRYLEENRGGATYLVATPSAMAAAPIILATGEPVMAMGGFSGGDAILTTDELAKLVRDGTVRFFLAGGPGPLRAGAMLPGMPPGMPPALSGQEMPDAGAVRANGPFPPPGAAPGAFPAGGPLGRTGAAMTWVTQNCTAVPAEATGGVSNGLYDCGALRG